jgi:hypothetical protein
MHVCLLLEKKLPSDLLSEYKTVVVSRRRVPFKRGNRDVERLLLADYGLEFRYVDAGLGSYDL